MNLFPHKSNIGDIMQFIRLHKLIVATRHIESMEWRDVEEELSETEYNNNLYLVVFHMKSGKKFTRRVYEKQLEQCKDALRNYLKGSEEE
tara:strand:- start:1273 stop:1542 length:270 start_codon:yes stop_codon:yes gene_type:complete